MTAMSRHAPAAHPPPRTLRSGSTFGTLNACHLLRGCTRHIFVVTSEWDTQIARAASKGSEQAPKGAELASKGSEQAGGAGGQPAAALVVEVELTSEFVFSTFAGYRPAEPCSLSVVAMHHLLSHVLVFLMGYTAQLDAAASLGGSSHALQEVTGCVTATKRPCSGHVTVEPRAAGGDGYVTATQRPCNGQATRCRRLVAVVAVT